MELVEESVSSGGRGITRLMSSCMCVYVVRVQVAVSRHDPGMFSFWEKFVLGACNARSSRRLRGRRELVG